MELFKPTFLYIKRHQKTGLLYFGKTCKEPSKYKGSGIEWKNHLKEHGDFVDTIWYCLFTTPDDIFEFASSFSEEFNIVESLEWANLIPETGIGRGYNYFHTEKTKAKIREARKHQIISPETGVKIAKSNRGQKRSPETIEKMRRSHLGKKLGPQPLEVKMKRIEAIKAAYAAKKAKV